MLHSPLLLYRFLFAVSLPFCAAFLQWWFKSYLPPLVWLLLYPSVFFAAWIGGAWAGLTATVVATGLGMYLFIPTLGSWQLSDTRYLYSIAVFMVMGSLFSVLHGRVRYLQRLVEDFNVKSLHQAELRWRFALEGSGQGVWDWDMQTDKVYFSPLWKSMLGYGEEEVSDTLEGWTQRVHPEDLPRVMQLLDDYLEGRTAHYVVEHRILNRAGEYQWILDRGMVVEHNAEGKCTRMVGTHTDISERKAMESQLQASLNRLQLFVNFAPVAIAIFDRDMRYLACSQRWREDFSLTCRHLIGESHYQVCKKQSERWKMLYQRGLAGERLSADEELFFQADGKQHWMRWKIYPWFEYDQAIGGIAVFCEDISRGKAIEADLELSIQRYQKLSAYTLQMREDERSRIAHEIHDELGGILTALSFDLSAFQKQWPDAGDKVNAMRQELRQGLVALKRIINDLRPSVLDHLGLLAAIDWLAQHQLERAGIDYIISQPDTVLNLAPKTATALFRVVQESLVNIVKHAQAKTVEIVIDFSGDTQCFALQIRDDGIGIPKSLFGNEGFGIQGMRERIRQLGGQFVIQPAGTSGTLLSIKVPL